LFHIDFGHFLGNFKSKFGVKRESAPFVFTRHFEAALGGRKAGIRYKQFQKLCVKAFLVLRRHANLLLALFSLMIGCGIPELRTMADLDWMYDALMFGYTEEQAAKKFLKLIHLSLKSKTTRVNHALHIMAKS
jgi:phosphatidylinositol-4,5-bisphosphate 3-kinase catalytic subunit alpha/beta/delta